MAGRDITNDAKTALESKFLAPVLIARFDIETDPLTVWTGPGTFAPSGTGDSALDGQIFVNAAPFTEITSIEENQGIGEAVTITTAISDDPVTHQALDAPLLQQVVKDKRKWRGRSAWLWVGFLDEEQGYVITTPVRIKTGVMTMMVVERKPEGEKVAVTIDQDLGRAKSAPLRWIDHTRFYPSDKWSTYILALANKPEGLTNTGLYFSGGSRGPGTDMPNRKRY